MNVGGEKKWKEVADVIFDYGRIVCHAAERTLVSEGDANNANMVKMN